MSNPYTATIFQRGSVCKWPDPFGAIVTIGQDGTYKESFDTVPELHCNGVDSASITGTAVAKYSYIDHGKAAGQAIDFSGVPADAVAECVIELQEQAVRHGGRATTLAGQWVSVVAGFRATVQRR